MALFRRSPPSQDRCLADWVRSDWTDLLAESRDVNHCWEQGIEFKDAVAFFFLGRSDALSFCVAKGYDLADKALEPSIDVLSHKDYTSIAECLIQYYNNGYMTGLQLRESGVDVTPALVWKNRPKGYTDPVFSAHEILQLRQRRP